MTLDQHGDRLVHLVADHACRSGYAWLLVCSLISSSAFLRSLPEHGLDARDIRAHVAYLVSCAAVWPARLLHAQVELFLAQRARAPSCSSLSVFLRSIVAFHHITARVTNVVLHRQLRRSQRGTPRARSSSVTPSISYSMRAGLHLGDPVLDVALAVALRTSSGFLVIGLSGNTRIQILPPRLTKRVMARRAASIWRAVRRPRVGGLQAVLAEADRVAALRQAAVAAFVLLAEFGSLGLQHGFHSVLSWPSSARELRALASLHLVACIQDLALEYPHLDADHAVGGLGFGETVVDVGAQRMQRHATFAVPLADARSRRRSDGRRRAP